MAGLQTLTRIDPEEHVRDVPGAIDIVDSCVKCGLCNAVCPTYQLEFDERDGPRGRILLMGNMLRRGGAPDAVERRHIGRCLSCMACVSACPAKVNYAHLIGHAKAYIRANSRASLRDKILNWFTARVVPHPRRLGWALTVAPFAMTAGRVLRALRLVDLAQMIEIAPRFKFRRAAFVGPGTAATTRERRGRVILLAGCAQQVLRPSIHDATIRLLARGGVDVEVAAGTGCCGAAASGCGDLEGARLLARANIDAWIKAISREPADAILFNSAGCGAAVKDYGHLLHDDPVYAGQAAEIASLAKDIAEYVAETGIGPPRRWSSLKVVYQAPCHLQHGQNVTDQPANLIHSAGFTVVANIDGDMCCGAAGRYAFVQPDISQALKDKKVSAILVDRPDVIATGSITCLAHLESGFRTPVVHTVELLDWAYGGPTPPGLSGLVGEVTDVPGPAPLDIQDYIRS